VLTKPELLQLLVAFASMNDTGLVDEDRILASEVCAPEDRALVREAAYGIRSLIVGFDYARSHEFQQLVAGKSTSVAAMLGRQAADPVHRKQHLDRFKQALAAQLTSDEARHLASLDQQAGLARVKVLLESVGNPPA
jgi:hypothetical protein